MDVYLIDGTYELFRHFYAVPSAREADGREVGAVRGVLTSMLGMINSGTRYIGVATDHVIESFRNRLWSGYKTGAGIDPDLYSQFPLLEEALVALGIATWPMVEYEADDALAAAAAAAARDPRVERVIICTPDKDLAQCVRGTRVVQMDRRTRAIRDEAGVIAKFGVPPASIPDYLALVGDAADGYPGLPGWGAKSAAAVLAKFGHLESIPADWRTWGVNATRPGALAQTLERERERVLLFRDLATLREDIPLFDSVDELKWRGPTPGVPAARRAVRGGGHRSAPAGTFAEAVRLSGTMRTITARARRGVAARRNRRPRRQAEFHRDLEDERREKQLRRRTGSRLHRSHDLPRGAVAADRGRTAGPRRRSEDHAQVHHRRHADVVRVAGRPRSLRQRSGRATRSIVVSKVTAIGVQFTDKMTLSGDGNTLTSAVRIDTAQGGVDVTVVFDRK